MKIFMSMIVALILMSAGCESADVSAKVNDTDTAKAKTEKNSEEWTEPTNSDVDYSNKTEIGDIAGNVTINGTLSNGQRVEGQWIKIYETEGKDIFLLDSAKVSGNNFTMNLKDVKVGIYKLGLKKFQLGELIINPNEKELNVTGNAMNMERTLKVMGSQENTALVEHRKLLNTHKAELKKIRGMKASTDAKLKLIYKQDEILKGQQDELADKYEGTFFSKMVRRMQSPNRFDKANYWKDIDFSDESLVRSMALNDRIQDYMRIHASKGGEDGFYNAADVIQDISSKSEKVRYFMLYTMMEGFYTSGMEDEAFYVADNYLHADACGDTEVANLVLRRADGLRSLQLGQTPPDFSIMSDAGKMVNMRDVASKNELTLIMFWASWCHKCEQEMPVIKRIYDANKAKGFEIIGVSVDMEKNAWKNGIQAKGCNWINVSQLEGWQSDVAKDYRISTTPVMFLVDSKGELILKPDRAFKLEKWMKENF